MKTTGDQQLVKRINRSVLLRLLRAQPGLSRAQLALQSGLTKSTVSTAARELIDEGWLVEATARPGLRLGRPSTPLQISTHTRGLVGVEVAIDCLRVVIVSLLGDVLWSTQLPLLDKTPEAVCARVAQGVAKAHAQLAVHGLLMSGVGLGLPGAFDVRTGVLRFAPNLGWRNVAIASMVAAAFVQAGLPDAPVLIQNEADAAALSEYEFDGANVSDALIFVTCDVGVGAGIVLNDHLFAGGQGLAGEIGHSILNVDGPLCSCGRHGCAETSIGAHALQRELQATGSLREAGKSLGVLLQNLWTSFDPGVLVVGGQSCVRHPELFEMACQTLQTYANCAGMTAPTVRVARYGLLAAAVGAAALLLHEQLRPMQAHRVAEATTLTEVESCCTEDELALLE